MLTLYHNDMSLCAQKVRICLAEKGLAWEDKHLVLRAAEHQQPWYLKHSRGCGLMIHTRGRRCDCGPSSWMRMFMMPARRSSVSGSPFVINISSAPSSEKRCLNEFQTSSNASAGVT